MSRLNPNPPERLASCPAPGILEALSAGEPQTAEVEAHVPGCAACRDYVASLESGREAFLSLRPPEQFLRKLEHREAAAAAPRRPWLFGLGAVFAAGLAFFVLQSPSSFSEENLGVRTKGNPFQVVYLRPGAEAPRVVDADARLKPGDALRFAYVAPEAGHLLVLDLDGTGKASVFVPFDGTRSVQVAAGSREMLPGSVVLDSAAGAEWLVAVFSKRPLEAAPLLKALEAQSGSNEVSLSCRDCTVTALRIQKAP